MKRKVSDEEFEAAYKNLDNVRVINAVLSKYRSSLTPDQLESCGLDGLWKALAGHEAGHNKKFTSSLHMFVKWECQSECRRKSTKQSKIFSLCLPLNEDVVGKNDFECEATDEGVRARRCVGMLESDEERELIRQHFLYGYSLREMASENGLGVEDTRQRLNRAVASLRDVYVGYGVKQDEVFSGAVE